MNNRIFWSMLDAFPCYFFSSLKDPDSRADSFARKSTELIGYNGIIQLEMEKHNKINVNLLGSSLVSIEDYKSFYGPFYSSIFDEIALLARDLKTKRISFISSTSRGGDITLMRQAQMRFYQLIGANVSWYVTIPVNTVSKIVKYKLRDVMESAVPEDTILQAQEIIDLENWTSMNVSRLWHNSVFKNTHIVIFDDLQTSGFVRYLREINPEAKIIFRSHIHMNAEMYLRNKAVTDVYNYITHNLEGIDLFVAQPMNTPIPQLGMHPIVYLSSSTDPLDGLNKTLSDTDRAYYTRIFRESCHEHTRKYFRFQSPYIIQTSSFDRLKGQKECIDAFRIIYDMISTRINDESDALYGLYLLIVGHGNIDDPEGTAVFNELVEYLNEQHNCAVRDRVLIVKIPPIEQILNVLIENARVALQLSQCDGFETRVTNCILKNVPAVVNNVGGLRLQVLENKTGYIVDRGDLQGVAHKVLYLLDNDSFRNGMIEYREYSFMFTTPFNVYGWLYICKVLVEGGVITEEDVFKQIIKKYFHKYAHEFLLKME
ncbi:Glycosyltransferase [Trachipleistophora hominis]|uniref:Glycosyltransferase n=1 Tax=Trachipleistophora hominis TaxID=72359 RepID=L7JT19_TRAHO|nr:Glycosyltransferase [Trachipleistophora hominis]